MEQLLLLCETDAQVWFLEELIDRRFLEGLAGRVTRLEAREIFKLTDNAMRQEINRMRSNGIPVMSGKGLKGYYFPKTMEEYGEFETEYLKPAIKRFQSNSKMKDIAFNFFNKQGEINEVHTDIHGIVDGPSGV